MTPVAFTVAKYCTSALTFSARMRSRSVVVLRSSCDMKNIGDGNANRYNCQNEGLTRTNEQSEIEDDAAARINTEQPCYDTNDKPLSTQFQPISIEQQQQLLHQDHGGL